MVVSGALLSCGLGCCAGTSKARAERTSLVAARASLTPASIPLWLAGLIVVCYYFFSSLFYKAVEGWDWWTCLYFCSLTLTTVGYGDVVPTMVQTRDDGRGCRWLDAGGGRARGA